MVAVIDAVPRILSIPVFALVCHVVFVPDYAYIIMYSVCLAFLGMWRPSRRSLGSFLERYMVEYVALSVSVCLHSIWPGVAWHWQYGFVRAACVS